jgi:hypothetical protein
MIYVGVFVHSTDHLICSTKLLYQVILCDSFLISSPSLQMLGHGDLLKPLMSISFEL